MLMNFRFNFTNHKPFLCLFLMLLFLFNCDKEESQENVLQTKQGEYNYVKATDIPNIVNFLENGTVYSKTSNTAKH